MARQAGFLRCAVTLLTLAGIAASPTLADTCPEPALIDDLPDPPELVAADGELRGTLTVAPAEITVRGCPVVSNVINGDYMAPTLRIRRGDTIRIRVVNQIGPAEVNIDGPQPTNIH
jgi:FtsP/CotA-like multicopper oxidase with cupredoxin domain